MFIRTALSMLLLSACGQTLAQTIPSDEAGFTEHVATLIRKEVGDANVVVKGPLTLGLGELQANLDRVFGFCKRDSNACATELDRYVKGAAQIHKDRSAPPTRESVRLVVRSSQYVQAAQSSLGGQSPQFQSRAFVEGLVILPVLDGPRTVRMLGSKDNTELGVSEAELFDLGLTNLRATLKPLMEVAKVVSGGQIGTITGNAYDTSRLILHDTWAPLAKAQGGTLIVAIPATDAVFYISEDTPVAVDALRALVKSVLSRAPSRLTNVLLRWNESGWSLVK